MNKTLKIFLIVAAVLLVGAVIARAAGWIGGQKSLEVELGKVELATIVETVSASGKIQPVQEVLISPEVSGEILEITVEEGDSVKKGQLLVKIRPDNYQAQLNQAIANLNNAKAAYAQAKARVSQAQSQYNQTEREFKRNQTLYKDSAISVAAFESAEAALEAQKFEIEAAKEQADAAYYTMKSSQAIVEDAENNLRKTTIFAPASGIVSKLAVEEGERVVGTLQMAGTEMLRIADLDRMEAVVEVSENDVVKITADDSARLVADSYPEDTLKGKVTKISHTAMESLTSDAVTEFEVRLLIDPASYSHLVEEGRPFPLRSGMTVTADISTETEKKVPSVPMQSIVVKEIGEKQQTVVYTYQEGKAIAKEVELGINDFERIQLLKGPKAGTDIIVGPYAVVSEKLKDSVAVEVLQEGE